MIEVCSYSKQDLKDERARFHVPLSRRGVIADYVPLFFSNRPPMLYSIKYHHGDHIQQRYVYLVTSTDSITKRNLPFCFTDGHAIMAITEYFDDLIHLPDVIDWSIIHDRIWKDTPDDNDRKRRKQAEFLVYDQVPWGCIESIVVKDNSMKVRTEEILRHHRTIASGDAIIPVAVKTDWYY